MSKWGSFSGDVEARWLAQANVDDRNMELLLPFAFTDPKGLAWNAPAGYVIDGASIPRALWTFVGSPYTGDYRRASVVHDVACTQHGVSRKAADRMFYFACREGGCGAFQAKVLYIGVRIGAWMAGDSSLQATNDHPPPFHPLPEISRGEHIVVETFQRAYYLTEMLEGEEDELDAIDQAVDAAVEVSRFKYGLT